MEQCYVSVGKIRGECGGCGVKATVAKGGEKERGFFDGSLFAVSTPTHAPV